MSKNSKHITGGMKMSKNSKHITGGMKMYKKRLKERFWKQVIRQAEIASVVGDVGKHMWICINYFDGMNAALCITHQYDCYMTSFTIEKFEYIFNSLVEYRKGVH